MMMMLLMMLMMQWWWVGGEVRRAVGVSALRVFAMEGGVWV